MPRKSYELQIRMRKDLFKAYREVCSKPCPSQMIAYHRTVKHPAPRFYVGSKIACNILYPYSHGDDSQLKKLSPLKQRMYKRIYEICLELSQKRQFQNKPFKYIVSFALLEPAPEFYISVESWRKLFRWSKMYGIDIPVKEAKKISSHYTNHKDGKPSSAIFRKKKHVIISQ